MRTFQVDSRIAEVIQSLQNVELQIGVILGRTGVGLRDFAYLLLQTPETGEGARTVSLEQQSQSKLPKKGSQKVGTGVQCNTAAVVEHALQVSPLLPGGVDIVGIYLVAPEAAAIAAVSLLAKITSQYSAEKDYADVPSLLLLVDPASKKMVGKELLGSGHPDGATKPCELKYQDLLGNLATLTCRHYVDIDVSLSMNGRSLVEQMAAHVGTEAERVQSALPSFSGRLLAKESTVADLADLPGSGTCEAPEIQLLCRPSCRHEAQGGGKQTAETSGRMQIQGCVVGRAYAYKRESALSAAALLKADVARSLHARLDVLIVEAEAGPGESPLQQPASTKERRIQFPRRAFFPVQGTLHFSDYVLPGEGAEQLLSTAAEALLLDIPATCLQWPEDEALQKLVPKSRLKGNEEATIDAGLGEGRPPIPFGFRSGQQVLVISTIICILSCMISWVVLSGALVR